MASVGVQSLAPPIPVVPAHKTEIIIFQGSNDTTPETNAMESSHSLEIHEPTSPLYGNITYDEPVITESSINQQSSQEADQEQRNKHDSTLVAKEQIFDQSQLSHKDLNYASDKKRETFDNQQSQTTEESEAHSAGTNKEQCLKSTTANQHRIESADQSSLIQDLVPNDNSKHDDASLTQSARIRDRRPCLDSNFSQKHINKLKTSQVPQSSKLTNKSSSDGLDAKKKPTSQSVQSSNSTRIAPKPSFRHIRPLDQTHLRVQSTGANKTQSSKAQGSKSDGRSKTSALFPPQPVKEQVSRIATITHLKSTTELKMNTQCAPKLPEKKSKQQPVAGTDNTQTVPPLPAPRTSRRKPNHSSNPLSKTHRKLSDNPTPMSSSIADTVVQPGVDPPVSQSSASASVTEATDSVMGPQRKSSNSIIEGTRKGGDVTVLSNEKLRKVPDLNSAAPACLKAPPIETSTETAEKDDGVASTIANSQSKTGNGIPSYVKSNAAVPCPDLSEPSPSPPFSPPSPKTAMLEVSSALQKVTWFFI